MSNGFGGLYTRIKRLLKPNNDSFSTTFPPEVASPIPAAINETSQTHTDISPQQFEIINILFYRWLFPNSLTALNAKEKEILSVLDATVRSEEISNQLVKRMPGLIPQVLQTLKNEDFSVPEIAKKLAQDIVLVEAVTRLATLAMKSSRENVKSIEQAVLILGQNGLRQLITGVAFKPIINVNDGVFTKSCASSVWEQSEECAAITRKIALAASANPLDAFLAGLVQSIGLIVALRMTDQLAADMKVVGSPEFYADLLRYSNLLTCKIAREWKFPTAVIRALEEQTLAGLALQGADVELAKPALSSLGNMLQLGDYLSKVQLLNKYRQFHDEHETGLSHIPPHLMPYC